MPWPWKKQPKEAPHPPPQQTAGELLPNRSSPAESMAGLEYSRRVDYSNFSDLVLNEAESRPNYATMTIIGLGAIGRAVLERLAARIPVDVEGVRPVALLSVNLKADQELDCELPETSSSNLMMQELLSLEIPRGIRGIPWYGLSNVGDLERPDGRLALFHSLRLKPSPLWDNLTRLLKDRQPDVWLVGSTFEAESGALADLAHLVRIIAKQQNYVPMVGWYLVLPGQDWAYSYLNRSMATLREINRLMRRNMVRNYEAFAPESDNYALHAHRERSDDDATAILLASPEQDSYGRQAIENLVERIALSLYCFAQQGCWTHPDVNLREAFRTNRAISATNEWTIHTIGVGVQSLPISELKNLVRARLTQDLLIGQRAGLIQTWSDYQLEDNESAARSLLEATGHPLLVLLSGIRSRLDFPNRWPDTQGADLRLADRLFDVMQSLLDQPFGAKGLQDCASLILGLTNLLESDVPDEVRSPLISVVNQAKRQLDAWRNWGKTIRKDLEELCKASQELWKKAIKQSGTHIVASEDLPDTIYKRMTGEAGSSILERARQYVRFSWSRENTILELGLDILAPGWKRLGGPSRFTPTPESLKEIWLRASETIAALSQEAQYWPTGLADPLLNLPGEGRSDDDLAPLLMPYKLQKAQDVHSLARLSLLVSGDRQWLRRTWLSTEEGARPAEIVSPYLGVILRFHFQIPLADTNLYPRLTSQYRSSMLPGKNLHVYLAEQTSFDLEQQAVQGVPHQKRQAFLRKGLSMNAIDLLEQAGLVEIFVLAWSAGYIKPENDGRAYVIVDDDQSQLWRSPNCSHPMDALVAFTRLPQEETEPLVRFLRSKLSELKSEQITERREQITEWWNSQSEQDTDWFILVNGYIRKMKL